MYDIPLITDALLDYLQKLHPEKAPEPSQSDREIWINRGAVGVVRHLQRIHQEQRENMLTGDITNVLRK
ncbi:hypothetical protein UFOVP63_21 [uncultured Caudovirales phage]|uniref:Uncharacterized protein n=1 Tax=uncultured Caudovirales phage TaxID=2100421 RepID=A0A6J5KRZ9_9CAUD|nr:hypothetical protein UFOVP63_21 [uncultured Caudovirales phage]